MKNPYYMIWSDGIQTGWEYHPDYKDWKIRIFLMTTWVHSVNWWIITIWLKYFKVFNWPMINIDFFPGTMLDGFASYVISYVPPFAILNYFLIFHRNRYKKIVDKYPYNKKGKLWLKYCIVILAVALITVYVYGIFLTHQY